MSADPTTEREKSEVRRPSRRPDGFTLHQLDWIPWLEPVARAELSDQQVAVLDGFRLESPYFRLLARDPAVLGARTDTDKAIFYGHGGLPRAERELAATATSRLNGCVYCASVHAALSAALSHREQDVQRLLDEGVAARIDGRWNAIVDAAAGLAATPPRLTDSGVAELRGQGLDDEQISDLVHCVAFFSWANRLMLTLGEPEVPAPAVDSADAGPAVERTHAGSVVEGTNAGSVVEGTNAGSAAEGTDGVKG